MGKRRSWLKFLSDELIDVAQKNNGKKYDKMGILSLGMYHHKLLNYKTYNQLCDKAKELLFVYNNRYGNRYGNSYCLLDIYDLSEYDLVNMSPIEQILYITFCICDFYITNRLMSPIIKPQSHIEINGSTYIADFCIYEIDTSPEIFKPLKKPIIIECDGYDYHSNKQQVEYDYKRENDLKANGFDVIRFTGSQIYKDPFGCVEYVYDYIFKNLERMK